MSMEEKKRLTELMEELDLLIEVDEEMVKKVAFAT